MRERGLVGEPVGIVAGGDEQDRSGVDPDAVDLEQGRRRPLHELLEVASRRVPSASSANTRRPSVAIAVWSRG